MLTLTTPDLRLFWTACDPLDLASASIDVLGFQAGYIALANKLLLGCRRPLLGPRAHPEEPSLEHIPCTTAAAK